MVVSIVTSMKRILTPAFLGGCDFIGASILSEIIAVYAHLLQNDDIGVQTSVIEAIDSLMDNFGEKISNLSKNSGSNTPNIFKLAKLAHHSFEGVVANTRGVHSSSYALLEKILHCMIKTSRYSTSNVRLAIMNMLFSDLQNIFGLVPLGDMQFLTTFKAALDSLDQNDQSLMLHVLSMLVSNLEAQSVNLNFANASKIVNTLLSLVLLVTAYPCQTFDATLQNRTFAVVLKIFMLQDVQVAIPVIQSMRSLMMLISRTKQEQIIGVMYVRLFLPLIYQKLSHSNDGQTDVKIAQECLNTITSLLKALEDNEMHPKVSGLLGCTVPLLATLLEMDNALLKSATTQCLLSFAQNYQTYFKAAVQQLTPAEQTKLEASFKLHIGQTFANF
jgi:hypothetical protein